MRYQTNSPMTFSMPVSTITIPNMGDGGKLAVILRMLNSIIRSGENSYGQVGHLRKFLTLDER